MRAAAAVVVAVLGVAACGPGPGVEPSQYAGLPPQDTLAGGYAPAPSTATGGAAAVPANPNAPASTGGTALTWASVAPAATGAAPGTAGGAGTGTAGGVGGGTATGGGAGAGGTSQPGAGAHVPTGTGPTGVKR